MARLIRGSQCVFAASLILTMQACNTGGNESERAGGSAGHPLLAKAVEQNPEVAADGKIAAPSIDSDTLAKLETEQGRAEVEAKGWFKDENGAAVRYDAARNQWDKMDQPPQKANELKLASIPFYSTWSAEKADANDSEETDVEEGLALNPWIYANRSVVRSYTWNTTPFLPTTTNRYVYNTPAVVFNTPTTVYNRPVTTFSTPAVNYTNPVVYNPNPVVNNTFQSGQGNVSIVNNNGAASGCWPSYAIDAYGNYRMTNPCAAGWATGAGANINIVTTSNTANGSFNNVNSNVNNGIQNVGYSNPVNTSNTTPFQPGERHEGAWNNDVANCRQRAINQCGRLPNYYWLHPNGYCQINC